MALKAIVESLDDMDDATKSLYREVENEGEEASVFVLDVEAVDGWALENVDGLKTALQNERSQHAAATSKLEAFKDIDPKKARDALSKVGEMANWTPEEKVQEQIAARETAITEKWEGDYNALKTTHESAKAQLENLLLDGAIKDALIAEKGNIRLLTPHMRAQTRLDEKDDGKLEPVVIGADGQPRFSKEAGSGTKLMSIRELAKELAKQDDFAGAFGKDTPSGNHGRKLPPPAKGGPPEGPRRRKAEAQTNLENALAGKMAEG